MASVSVFDLTRFTALAAGDVLPAVDISNTSQNAHGSLLSITVTNFFASIPVPVNVTSASATALAVGLTGATNPAFTVDASTASQVAGLKITGAATGGTVAVVVTDSGANANLTVNAKGSGTIGIGSVSTGRVTITPVVTITGALTQTGLATFNGGATIASGQTFTVTGATITGLTAASVGAGTFPAGAFVFQGALSGITTLATTSNITATSTAAVAIHAKTTTTATNVTFRLETANRNWYMVAVDSGADATLNFSTNADGSSAAFSFNPATSAATFGGNVALGTNNLTLTGSIASTGSRVTKGWFTDLEVTNAIVGNISGSAATLTTTRTIWGRNFNGSANVTGALSSVTDITMSGTLAGNIVTATDVASLAVSASSSLAVASGASIYLDGVGASGDTHLFESAANRVDLVIGGTTLLRMNATLMGFGGVTASFPALKRSSAVLDVRLGDDSAFADLRAALVTATNGLNVSGALLQATAGLTATTGNFSGLLLTTASASGGAGFRLPHGAAPSAPVDGDMWTTTAGLFVRINGATVGPLS